MAQSSATTNFITQPIDSAEGYKVNGTNVVNSSGTVLNQQQVQTTGATIATTGNTDVYMTAPFAGTLASLSITPLVALATSDTNYITWTATNLGQAGAGSTAMLAATDSNTTKATGGTALSISTPRSLTLSATSANLVVAAGDVIRIRAAATNTLANTVTVPVYSAVFTRTS